VHLHIGRIKSGPLGGEGGYRGGVKLAKMDGLGEGTYSQAASAIIGRFNSVGGFCFRADCVV